jgi:hypothetical protein
MCLHVAARAAWCSVYTLGLGAAGAQQEKEKKKQMTLGWVVNGGRRHADLQGDLIPHGCWVNKACLPVTDPTPVFFTLIHVFCLAQSLLYWGTILFRCAAATCVMLAWTFCCAGFSLIPRLLRISTFLIGTVALTPTVITCTVGLTFQPSLSSSRRSLV